MISTDLLIGLLATTIGAAGGIITKSIGPRGSRENALLDQYQEDRLEDHKRIAELETEVRRLSDKVTDLIIREQIWSYYVKDLEDNIRAAGGIVSPRPDGIKAPYESGENDKRGG